MFNVSTKESNIKIEFNKVCSNHNISYLNKNDFHQFINGLYQAEGTMVVYFPKIDSLTIRFSFSIGQNYSPEALNVLLNLQKILGIGNIKLEFNSKGQPHIRYNVYNTKDIFQKVLPYFSLLYGQKRRDLIILREIYKISFNKYFEADTFLVSRFIHLVYSINPEGNKRKVLLSEKLAVFNCSSLIDYNDLSIEENKNLPSDLFIIGLFLGDGSLGFVFDSPSSRFPIFYIKIVFNFAAQSNTHYNVQLLKEIARKMNLKPQISERKSGMIDLVYSGKIVFEIIVPFLNKYQDWLFWRKNQFINAQKIAVVYKDKGHLTKDGLINVIDLLYSVPNKYLKPKEYWINLIEKRVWK